MRRISRLRIFPLFRFSLLFPLAENGFLPGLEQLLFRFQFSCRKDYLVNGAVAFRLLFAVFAGQVARIFVSVKALQLFQLFDHGGSHLVNTVNEVGHCLSRQGLMFQGVDYTQLALPAAKPLIKKRRFFKVVVPASGMWYGFQGHKPKPDPMHMRGFVPPDPETQVSEVHPAVVYVPRRSRNRFPQSCVQLVESEDAARAAADESQKRFAARVIGPSKSSEGQYIFYLLEWL